MRLDVVGAGPAYTDRPGATGAAYLVRYGGAALLLDLGQGSFPRLAGLVDPADLDAVVISHLHPDHFIDLIPLRHYLRWEQPRRRVRVLGPDGLEARLDALHGEPGFSAAALDIEWLAEGRRTIGPFELEAARVTHTESSFGFRISLAGLGTPTGEAPDAAPDEAQGGPPDAAPGEPQGKATDATPDATPDAAAGHASEAPGLVYSGDCGRAEDLDALVRPGDTLLCEVSFGPGPVEPGAEHLDAAAVGALVQRARAGRVLLTHLQMGYDRAATVDGVRARFDGGPVELVDPGFETAIGS